MRVLSISVLPAPANTAEPVEACENRVRGKLIAAVDRRLQSAYCGGLAGCSPHRFATQQMDFDVNAYRDAQGRWHRQILGPLPLQAADAPVYEECHDLKASTLCIGFSDFTMAINDGWQRVRVILRQTEGKPQKAASIADEVRSKP